MQLTLEQVRRALHDHLQGQAAHQLMMAMPRSTRRSEMPGTPRQSAVLIALYERDGELWFPLTVRSQRVSKHKGQISLPGGAMDQGDGSFWRTALREANEELGIDSEGARQLGHLSELCILSSGFCVHPYVAAIDTDRDWIIQPDEVAQVIEAPLSLIFDESAKQVVEWSFESGTRSVPHYAYQGHVIWGATAMILSEFEQALRAELMAHQATP